MQVALDLIALTATLVAVVYDERYRRIPNYLSYGSTLLGLAVRCVWLLADDSTSASSVLLPGAIGAVTLAALFGALSLVGVLGFGDTKLLVGVGLCVGHPMSLELALCVLLSGGVVALIQALRAGRLGAVLQNMGRARELVRERVDETGSGPRHLFGYAVAIALGTLWAVVGRHLPSILPL